MSIEFKYVVPSLSLRKVKLRFVQNKEVLMDCLHIVNLRSSNQLEISS